MGNMRVSPSSSARGKYDPDDLLKIYARDFEEKSVEAVLLRSEDILSEEYFAKISSHASLRALQEALPKCRIPQNVNAYCDKVRQLLSAEEELVKAQKEMKKADDYVKDCIEKEKRMPKRKKEKDLYHTPVVLLLILPLFLLIPAFIGGRYGRGPAVKTKSDLKILLHYDGNHLRNHFLDPGDILDQISDS